MDNILRTALLCGLGCVVVNDARRVVDFDDHTDAVMSVAQQVPTDSWIAKELEACRGETEPDNEEPEPEKQDYDAKAKEWLRKMAVKTKCDYLRRPVDPCGKALEGKWRGKWWRGFFKSIGETVWTDVSMNESEAAFQRETPHMMSVTKRYGWTDMMARWIGDKTGIESAQEVGIQNEEIVQWTGSQPTDPEVSQALALAQERFRKMQLEDMTSDIEAEADDGSSNKPVCVVERSGEGPDGGKKTFGVVYKVSALSGAEWLEADEEGADSKSGQVAVTAHKGGSAGQVAPGKILKVSWYDPGKITDGEFQADLVESEWTKVLEPLGVMPLNEEQRRARVVRLIIDKMLGHVEIIRSGGKWGPSWLRSWSSYCTFSCVTRWIKVFYYSWKINFETQKLMWLSQRQLGFTASGKAGNDFQGKVLDELDVTTSNGLEKLGSFSKRGLWKFMSFMVETVDNNVFLRTQIFFFHSIKQMLIGWIARILGIDDLTMACKWKKILDLMETRENYTKNNPRFWSTFTAWCPGWMDQLDKNYLTYRAFDWVYNNTAWIGEKIASSWLAKTTQRALEAVIRKIHDAIKTGSQAVLQGVMTVVDTVLINRLMSMGVIDEEEKKMMEANSAPPPYPDTSDEQSGGCVSYYTTNWIVPKTRSTYGGLYTKVIKDHFVFSESFKGRMRVRVGALEEGVLEMRRFAQCKTLTVAEEIMKWGNKVFGPDQALHVVTIAEVSDIVDIGATNTSIQGVKLADVALAQKALQDCGEGDEHEEGIDFDTKSCRLLRSKWRNLPQETEEEICSSVVHGAQPRETDWLRRWQSGALLCKCPREFHVAGGANCTGEGSTGRYFDPAKLSRFECACENKNGDTIKETPDPLLPSIHTNRKAPSQYCVLMLYKTDEGWDNHILCSAEKKRMQEWKRALELHRYAYGKEDKTIENEFAALLGKELDAAEVTVEEVMSRHSYAKNSSAEIGAKIVQDRMTEMQADLRNGGKGSFVEVNGTAAADQRQQQLAALGAALSRSNAAVDAAVATYAKGFELIASDAVNIHKALDVFQQVFLEAHSHVRLLHEHGATVVSYYCKTHDSVWESYTSASYYPGDCIKSYEYNTYTHGNNWVVCYNVYNCDSAMTNHAIYSDDCFWGGCAYQITQSAENMIIADMSRPPPGAGCFPSSALVEVSPGPGLPPLPRPIGDVRVGDLVRGAAGFERVYAVTTHDPEAVGLGLRMMVQVPGSVDISGVAVLELTANHLLHVGARGELRRADAVRVGDELRLAGGGGLGAVLSIVTVRSHGLHNVKTPSGTIAVRAPGAGQAVLASTATDVGPEWARPAHLWLEAPLSLASRVAPGLVDVGGALQQLVRLYEGLAPAGAHEGPHQDGLPRPLYTIKGSPFSAARGS